MKKSLMYLLLTGSIFWSTISANAVTNQLATILSVTTVEPQSDSAGTDASLTPSGLDYILEVRVGATVYDLKYASALDYLPANLTNGSSLGAQVRDHHIYLETTAGELETAIVSKHQAKLDMAAN